MAVAYTGAKAMSKVFLKTGHPYDELYAVLVRRDEAPVDPKDTRFNLERFVGPLEQYTPRHTRGCAYCEGRGFKMESEGSPVKCGPCEGTGVRLRRTPSESS